MAADLLFLPSFPSDSFPLPFLSPFTISSQHHFHWPIIDNPFASMSRLEAWKYANQLILSVKHPVLRKQIRIGQSPGGRAPSLRGRSWGTDCSHWTPPAAKMCLLEGESLNAEWPVFGPHFTSFSKPLGLQRSLATEAKDQFRKVLSRAFLSSSWPSHLVWNSRRFITDCPQQWQWKGTSWYVHY